MHLPRVVDGSMDSTIANSKAASGTMTNDNAHYLTFRVKQEDARDINQLLLI